MKYQNLIDKCLRVLNSCETIKQFNSAVKYVNLAAETKEVQADSYRVINFIVPMERIMAITGYRIKASVFNVQPFGISKQFK